jgi:7,8-dihydropterin-6-yl-methyl-4-(beta-D-ribofuranosyl)aminobenzene 5'-phosphate synthase
MHRILYLIGIGLLVCAACQTSKKEKEPESLNLAISSIEDNSITNLYDAFGKTQDGLIKDFGFSALVKYNGKLILFDAGTNADILKNNASVLGTDLKEVDFAIGSHAHGDHLNGFDYLLSVNPNVKIYLPFDFYVGAHIGFNIAGKEKSIKDSLPLEMQYFGAASDNLDITLGQSGRFWNANVTYIKENTVLEDGISLISTRSPYLGYGSKYPSVDEMKGFANEEAADESDEIKFVGLPELSLSLATNSGEVLVVGCSHSSVQNIIRETKQYRNKEIALLYGGYHMLPYDRSELNKINTQLQVELKVKKIAPAHCTGHLAFKILKDAYKENYIFAGLGESVKFE